MLRRGLACWLLLLALALTAPGCSSASKSPVAPVPEPALSATAAATTPPPPVNLVLEYLKQGVGSPDGRWLAAIAPGDENARGLWLAKADTSEARRIAADVSVIAGQPRWSPAGTLLYAADRDNVTWFEYEVPNGPAREYLPVLLKGKGAMIGPGAFGPDGKQFVFSTTAGDILEAWIASTDGSNPRQLGTNVRARWVEGKLEVSQVGK